MKTFCLLLCSLLAPQARGDEPVILNAADLHIAMEKLGVLGSVLYVAAHPDDENPSLLAFFSKEKKFRTAYLSITRGDGGQNLIGPEKGAVIGLIRTQELLSARRLDGAEQFFTRAIDFGYSKTVDETLALWGRESVLGDMVWVIRQFRPDVIITRFPPWGERGHGHHRASAKLTVEAYHAAADPNRFVEHLQYVSTWQSKRLFYNAWRPKDPAAMLTIDIGSYNPLLGLSYSEIGAETRSMHKSQGFGAGKRRGSRLDYLQQIEGPKAKIHIMEGVDTTWNRVAGGTPIAAKWKRLVDDFDPQQPSRSVRELVRLHAMLAACEQTPWVVIKRKELLKIIQSAAGLWAEAIAQDYSATAGDELSVKITLVNRSAHPFILSRISFWGEAQPFEANRALLVNKPTTVETKITIPKQTPISQPFWLRQSPSGQMFGVSDLQKIHLAQNRPAIPVRLVLKSENHPLVWEIPVQFRKVDRVHGEIVRPFEIRPKVTLNIDQKVYVFPQQTPQTIKVRLKSHTDHVNGTLGLQAAAGWQVSPSSVGFETTKKYQEKTFSFLVKPPPKAGQTILTVKANVSSQTLDRDLVEIAYPHIEHQVYFPASQARLVRLDIVLPKVKIGYIMGAGDEVAEALGQLGYPVELLDDEELEHAELSRFDTLVVGVRAFNTRPRLVHLQGRLLDYVAQGGTLVVQYSVSYGLLVDNIGPYPLTIGWDRVTQENAPVVFLNPDHPLLSKPNRLSQQDFEGWVQERGLYFATQWDSRYEALLSCADDQESPKKGGLLVANFGKGTFIYSGYSFFRQLPKGVPGAYRLFVNLIAAGQK